MDSVFAWSKCMELGSPHIRLGLELRILQDEYVEMRSWAHEAKARGYQAVFASAEFAAQAHRLCRRAVKTFNEVACLLRRAEDTSNIYYSLLRTTQQLKLLFEESFPEDSNGHAGQNGLLKQDQSLESLFYAIDREAPCHSGGTLHEQILSVSAAACAALVVLRPPTR